MNLARIKISSLSALIGATTCVIAHAQNGTSGTTDGSGRGTGSSGVMLGSGPDTRPSRTTTENSTAVVVEEKSNTNTTTNHKKSVHKQSRKTGKRARSTPSPSPKP